MAFQVSSDASFAEPWNGRSTPTTRVWPSFGELLLLPPPHPAAATAATASTDSALIRLFILFLSLLKVPVRPVDRQPAMREQVRRLPGMAAGEPVHSWRTGRSHGSPTGRLPR